VTQTPLTALDEIVDALRRGRLEVVDAGPVEYFDTIPHDRLMKLVAATHERWERVAPHPPMARHACGREESNGKKTRPAQSARRAQGGVISPLLANLYLNALDWAVNTTRKSGASPCWCATRMTLSSCAPPDKARPCANASDAGWPLAASNSTRKDRLVDSRNGFDFLGFRVRWQPSRVSGKMVCPCGSQARAASNGCAKPCEAKLNHWTQGQRIPDVMAGLTGCARVEPATSITGTAAG